MFDITCLDSFGNVINTFTQWDINQTLYIEDSGFDIAPIFHFCNQNTEKALCVQSEFNSDHVLTVKVPNQLLVEPYSVIIYVYIGSGDSFKTIEYLRFPLRARPQPHDFLFAENVEVVWLKDLIKEVQELNESMTEAETERLHNETIRITNENTRIQAEKEREAAEALRKKAETERNTAENLRKENEKNREASESSRNQNENERKTKESERQTAEGIRKSNEDTRRSSENARAQNESNRQDAEKIRQANEDTRCSNEDSREQKESERQMAESERSTNESNRSKAEKNRKEAETARATAEASRENAESARNDAEQKRTGNENARRVAESQRETDEKARQDAEKQRIETENRRAENESARITAETARDDAENIREFNEQQRISNESARNDAEAERIAEFDRMTDAINDKIAEANQIIEDNGNAKSNADEGVGKAFKGLNDWQKEKLKKIVRYLDPNSNIIFIDTYPLYMEHLHGGANMYSNFTPYASLRLIADIALPHVESVLYLDCDVAVQGDVTEMYHSYLKMGHDYYAYFCPDACDNEGEMVSGVLLMDLRKMRKNGFLKRARENFKKNKYNYPDQCALRDAGKAFPLPETYSYMYELEKCHYKPAILHFTNQLGPKIYHVDYGRNYFYKRYPAFEYVKKGVEWLDTIDL